MGFWKTLGGGLLALGGVATGQPSLIAAGGNMIANSLSGDSVKKANEQQQAATDQAQGKLDTVYGQTRSDISPYIQTGQSAINSLGQMVGLPGVQTAQASGEIAGANNKGTIAANTLADLMGGHQPSADAQVVGTAVARNPQAAQSQTGSSYVTVQAPNGGPTKQVPADQASYWQSKGATVVN